MTAPCREAVDLYLAWLDTMAMHFFGIRLGSGQNMEGRLVRTDPLTFTTSLSGLKPAADLERLVVSQDDKPPKDLSISCVRWRDATGWHVEAKYSVHTELVR